MVIEKQFLVVKLDSLKKGFQIRYLYIDEAFVGKRTYHSVEMDGTRKLQIGNVYYLGAT